VVVVLTAWMVAGFWGSVDRRTPQHPYLSPTGGLPWVQASGGGPRGFFRLDVALQTIPDTATLWMEADQTGVAYVNGFRVNRPVSSVLHDVDTGADLVRGAQVVDLTAALVRGGNVVGLEVVNEADRSAAFRAVIVLRYGASEQILGTRPGDWRATDDVSLTDQQVPTSGAFSVAKADDSGWGIGVRASDRIGHPTQAVPPDAMEQPAGTAMIAGRAAGPPLHAVTTITVPPGRQEAWLRVAATGPYTVSLDGRVIASDRGRAVGFGQRSELAPSSPAPPPVEILDIFDVRSLLRPGRHRLSVEVASGTLPAFYLDGSVRTAHGTDDLVDASAWHLASGAPAITVPLNPSVLHPFERRLAPTQVQSTAGVISHLRLTLLLLAVAAAAAGLTYLRLRDARAAIDRVAVYLLPAAGCVLVLVELRHIVDFTPPFPSTPLMLAVLLGTAAVGIAASVISPAPEASARRIAHVRTRVTEARKARLYTIASWGFATVWAAVNAYHLRFEPVWQDELSSLAAAQGLRAHGIPVWPSGFQYWKSELFNVLIAGVGALTHDSVTWLRGVSVFWLGATILLFAFGLAPTLLPRRRLLQFAATVVFAIAPFEVAHARDIRMYQMAQFFVVLVSVLLLHATLHSTPRKVAIAMLAVVGMYLTHEETYGVVVLVPVLVIALQGLQWVRRREWWIFGGAAALVIAGQLYLAKSSHPPIFGVDQSNGPLVRWSPAPFFYVDRYFFIAAGHGSSITAISILALVAIGVGIKRRDTVRLYFAAFWIFPVAVVSLTLPSKDTRYGFIVLPFTFILAFCAVDDLLGPIRALVRRAGARQVAARVGYRVLTGCVVVGLGLSVIGSASDLGVLIGGLVHANVSQRQLDYQRSDSYVVTHEQPGDIVIAATSANLVGYGIGRAPDYVMPFRRGSRLLYEFEKGDQAVDTQYGSPVINDGPELERVVDEHRRVWVVATDSEIVGLLPQQQQILRSRFTLVQEGASVSTFLATN